MSKTADTSQSEQQGGNVSGMGSGHFLVELTQGYRLRLALAGVCSAGASLLALAPYFAVYLLALQLPATGSAGNLGDNKGVWTIMLGAGVAVIVRFMLNGASSMLAHASAFRILYGLRRRLVEKLGRLPLGYFGTQNSGRLKKIVSDDVERLESFLAHHLPDLTTSALAPLVGALCLALVDWRMTLAALLPIPAALFVQRLQSRSGRRSDRLRRIHGLSETMNKVIVEYIRAMPVIKSFNRTGSTSDQYEQAVIEYSELWSDVARQKVPLYAIFLLLLESGLLFIVPIGLWLHALGSLGLPEFLLFILVGSTLTAPLRQLANLIHGMENNLEGARRILSVLETDEQQVQGGAGNAVGIEEPLVGESESLEDLVFEKVSFAYGERFALEQVSFTAKAGEITALVGPSGAGKSTAAQMAVRFFDPDRGVVKLGGHDLRHWPLEALMEQVAFVFQDVPILSDTVEGNLRMGRVDASDEELVQAAKAASAHDFIAGLPEGYRTKIGEGGLPLSGGQRQRLAIARAILKDAPVLILDEATAYADSENEARIQEALGRLLIGKTAIVIAHRLSTIQHANRIVVFDQGRVLDQGRHTELLDRCALYRRLWDAHEEAGEWSLGAGKEKSVDD